MDATKQWRFDVRKNARLIPTPVARLAALWTWSPRRRLHEGTFLWSLVATDVCSGWTKVVPLLAANSRRSRGPQSDPPTVPGAGPGDLTRTTTAPLSTRPFGA